MRLLDFYRTLNRDEREAFAGRIGTSLAYLTQLAYGHRRPGNELTLRILEASAGAVDARRESFGPPQRAVTDDAA